MFRIVGISIKFFLLILFFITIGCFESHSNEEKFSFKVDVDHPLTINNKGGKDEILRIFWEGAFLNFDSIINTIKNLPDEYKNEPLERKSWRFVIKQLNFYRNPLESPEIHHPLIQLNSIGYGQCDDFATLLYFIWIKQGFKARIWGLGKHVVPEIFIHGKWQMYDAAFQTYYLNKDGIPASVEELTNNNNLILHPNKILKLKEHNNIPSDLIDTLRNGMSVCKHYLSSKDHFENKSYYQTFELKDFRLCIPTSSTIVLPVYKPKLMNQVDWSNNTRDNNYYLKLVLPKNTTGKICMPLILIEVEGNITFRTSNKKNADYKFPNKNREILEIIDTSLSIVSVNEPTNLYYKLPEKFKSLTPITVIVNKKNSKMLTIHQ
jgi:hypothetical protein